jgi:hypothetical protein
MGVRYARGNPVHAKMLTNGGNAYLQYVRLRHEEPQNHNLPGPKSDHKAKPREEENSSIDIDEI